MDTKFIPDPDFDFGSHDDWEADIAARLTEKPPDIILPLDFELDAATVDVYLWCFNMPNGVRFRTSLGEIVASELELDHDGIFTPDEYLRATRLATRLREIAGTIEAVFESKKQKGLIVEPEPEPWEKEPGRPN